MQGAIFVGIFSNNTSSFFEQCKTMVPTNSHLFKHYKIEAFNFTPPEKVDKTFGEDSIKLKHVQLNIELFNFFETLN